jgi:hypothetical protein
MAEVSHFHASSVSCGHEADTGVGVFSVYFGDYITAGCC